MNDNMKKNKKKKRIVVSILVSLILIIALGLAFTKTDLRKILSNIADTGFNSKDIDYDNEGSNMESSNMQDAIDELYAKCLKLKEECPEGYICTSKEDKEAKDELVKKIKEAEASLSSMEEIDEELQSKVNEAKNAIYEDDYDKIKEIKEKIDVLNEQ